jgi:hypothetical protein
MSEYTSGEDVRTSVIAGNTFGSRLVTFSVIEGLALFEGDILLGNAETIGSIGSMQHARHRSPVLPRAAGITGVGFRWPGGTIPFTIDPALPNQTRVTNAILHWARNTFIRFVQRTTEAAFVTFRPSVSVCNSSVGMIGGQQFINLAAGCDLGATIHEIGHTVGLWHEQSREDRNSFVQVDFSKILPDEHHNFQQHVTDGDDIGPYDFSSIMHYTATAFAITAGETTINSPVPIGQRNGLSAGDKAAVGVMYDRTALSHAIRRRDGSWTQFGDVESQAGDRGTFVTACGAGPSGIFHLCGVNSEGGLWHSIRRSDGTWTRFGEVKRQARDRGSFVSISAAGVGNDLHVCGVTTNGRLWHTIRFASGAWAPFGDIESHTGDRGFIAAVSCAAIGDKLHVCGISSRGRFWHALRKANGSWTPFGDVEDQTGDRGFFYSPSCANVAGELHVCGVDSGGHLWHAIRRVDGSWTPFGDLEGETGDRGSIVFASCAGIGDELHVCAINSEGRLWHSVRQKDGFWRPFGDVEGQAGDRGSFWRVGLAEVAGEIHMCGVSVL